MHCENFVGWIIFKYARENFSRLDYFINFAAEKVCRVALKRREAIGKAAKAALLKGTGCESPTVPLRYFLMSPRGSLADAESH